MVLRWSHFCFTSNHKPRHVLINHSYKYHYLEAEKPPGNNTRKFSTSRCCYSEVEKCLGKNTWKFVQFCQENLLNFAETSRSNTQKKFLAIVSQKLKKNLQVTILWNFKPLGNVTWNLRNLQVTIPWDFSIFSGIIAQKLLQKKLSWIAPQISGG